MFHYGRGHSGTFQETYRAFPLAFIDKQSADYGDKVILPPSALHKLGERGRSEGGVEWGLQILQSNHRHTALRGANPAGLPGLFSTQGCVLWVRARAGAGREGGGHQHGEPAACKAPLSVLKQRLPAVLQAGACCACSSGASLVGFQRLGGQTGQGMQRPPGCLLHQAKGDRLLSQLCSRAVPVRLCRSCAVQLLSTHPASPHATPSSNPTG